MRKKTSEEFNAEAEAAFSQGAGGLAAGADTWEDGQPKTPEQRQTDRHNSERRDPHQVLTAEATQLPAGQLSDILRYLPVLVEVVAELKQLARLPVGESTDLGPVKTWLPTGGEYVLTVHAERKA